MPNNDAELEKNQPKKTAKSKSAAKSGSAEKKSAPKDDKSSKSVSKNTDAKADKVEPAKNDVADKAPKDIKVAESVSAEAESKKTSDTSSVKANSSTTATTKKKSLKDHRPLAIRIVAGIVAVFLVVIIVFGVMIYAFQSDSPVVKAVAGVIPYPVERVNGGINFVPYSAYLFEVDANKKAIQNNAKLSNQPAVNFNSAEGKKQVVEIKKHALDKLKSDELTAELARKYKVTVSNKEVNDLVNQFYTRYGGKDTLLKTLKEYYGWNLNDLKSVIYKQLLSKKLEEKVVSDPVIMAQTKAKVDAVAKELKGGADFVVVAKKSSQASDAANGGDLGTFAASQVPAEIQKALAATPVGSISDPVKTQFGYEIIKVTAKDGDNYTASHILVKSLDYTVWFNDQLTKAKVNTYIVVK